MIVKKKAAREGRSTYTVRYAHLFEPSKLQIGDIVTSDNIIGIMGTSGQSKHNHLHIDVVEGFKTKIIRLKDIGPDKKYVPNEKQLNYFNDKDLFKIEPVTTTPYMSKKYKELFGKDHPALDLVPIDRHKTTEHFKIHWNRSKFGIVLAVGYDKNGYGHYINIGFEI